MLKNKEFLKSTTDKILLNVKQDGPSFNMNLRLHLLILRAPKTWGLRGDPKYIFITPKIYATTFFLMSCERGLLMGNVAKWSILFEN